MIPSPRISLLLLCLISAKAPAADAPPRSTDPRVTIELYAESPQIKTPTGIDVDSKGRVFAIESNTHFRPNDYKGPESDRLLILTNPDEAGRCQSVKVFYEGFRYGMSVAVRPAWMAPIRIGADVKKATPDSATTLNAEPFQVFLATRKVIYLLEDTDGDDICDRQTELAWLETQGDYPHNGLAGFAFDARGWMYFGFGENLGADYALFSREMKERSKGDEKPNQQPLRGGGEGGNMYRMRPDGTGLSHWATGFWNPHASCFDGVGNLFTVDNDPDSRPPCRLLHVIEGGDYGFRFRNGRRGLHPFTAWNGELPGTLPMVAGTGEAPSGVVVYESDALPDEYFGRVFVPSWGDHRVDTFVLKPKGGSFQSVAEPLIIGGENFRPVGIALAPDGSLFCTDWVLRDYKIHGQGRIWRIRPTDQSRLGNHELQPIADAQKQLKSKRLTERRLAAHELDQSEDGRQFLGGQLFLSDTSGRVTAEVLATRANMQTPELDNAVELFKRIQTADPFSATHWRQYFLKTRIGLDFDSAPTGNDVELVVLARQLKPKDSALVASLLTNSAPIIRQVAVQWAAEEKLDNLKRQVEAVLKSEPMTPGLFLATLAAIDMLNGKPPQEFEKTPSTKLVLPLLNDSQSSVAVKIQALKLVDPTDGALDLKLVSQLAQSDDPQLQLEAVRTLAASNRPEALPMLKDVVATPPSSNRDRKIPVYEEAVLGLANFVLNPATADAATQSLLAALTHVTGSVADADVTREIILSLQPRLQDPKVKADVQTALSALPPRPAASEKTDEQWRAALSRAPDESDAAIVRGRILFFHPNSVACSKCHVVDGRGGKIGPDLSHIGGSFTREKLIDSILEPSKEISPQFTNWLCETKQGQIRTGMIVYEDSGKTILGQADGKLITVATTDIEERTPQSTSVMPEKLEEKLTVADFNDLLAFLQSLK